MAYISPSAVVNGVRHFVIISAIQDYQPVVISEKIVENKDQAVTAFMLFYSAMTKLSAIISCSVG